MKRLKKHATGYNTVSSTNGLVSARGVKSKPNNLQIFGFTHEVGEGEKSPDTPYELMCLDSGKINEKMIFYGNKNKFIGEFYTGGYVSFSGNMAVNSNSSYCDILVEENTKYALSKKELTNFYTYTIAFFDENKKKIAVASAEPKYNTIPDLEMVKGGNYFIRATFTTPKNCKYIRVSWLATSKLSIQLETGSTATSYIEPCNSICTDEHSIIISNNDASIQVPVPAALNSVNSFSDYIYKDTDNLWKLVQNTATIDSYNNEYISTPYISSTGELSAGATVIYQLETPVEHALSDYAQDLLNSFTLQNNNKIFVEGYPDIKISGYIQK